MKKILISIALISSLIVSCDKDYLNEPKPTSSVSSSVIFTSRDGVNSFISGILRASRLELNLDRLDTGGLPSLYFARTVKGNDLVLGVQWYRFDYNNDNRDPTDKRTIFSWAFPYTMINELNILIKGINDSEDLSETDKDETLSQALTLRAFYYFQLAMEFQHTYSYDASLPAPPIYTSPALEGKAMSTLTEMYTLILSDLNDAVEKGADSRLDKSYINKNVTYGILARVNQVMGNWSAAEIAASKARIGYSLNASNYSNGFNNIEDEEWIWGIPQTVDQTITINTAPHSFTDNSNKIGYGEAFWNEDFVNRFSDTDVRNTFFDLFGLGDNSGSYKARASSKFKLTFDPDIPLMRSPEMLLIEAEAKARQDNDNEAATLLFSLQKNRDPKAVASGNSGTALIDEILVERRKELYGEIGVEWFDAKRLRKGITRTGNHRVKSPGNLLPDDKKFFLKVPQSEIDANDNIDASVNADR